MGLISRVSSRTYRRNKKNRINGFNKIIEMNQFDTLLAQTCVEDCLDRLSILGSIASIHPRQSNNNTKTNSNVPAASSASGDNYDLFTTNSVTTSGIEATQNSNAIAHTLKSESSKA